MATIQITDVLEITEDVKCRYSINVQTGALVVGYSTGGTLSSMAITTPSEINVVAGSTLTFTLNGDVADITRI
jgi:hypothetical protein